MAISADWPADAEYSEMSAMQFERLKALIEEARFVTAELPGNDKYTLLYGDDSLVEDNEELINKLVRDVAKLKKVDEGRGLRLAASGRDVWLDISEDVLYEHQSNLERRLADVRAQIATLEQRLASENYVAKAPPHLVAETRQQLEQATEHAAGLVRELDVLA